MRGYFCKAAGRKGVKTFADSNLKEKFSVLTLQQHLDYDELTKTVGRDGYLL
ncbi:MAG: hypothetical protein HDQ96_02940 [Lachnospiraceae bacterium]|nr:hypothetical protein [Lachnospiraceae bacterium]